MKLTIAKRVSYVVLGSLACFVLIFNPVILEWFAVPVMPEFSNLVPDPDYVEPARVNWWTTTIIPGVLYIGKRFVDWFFDNVMPSRSTA